MASLGQHSAQPPERHSGPLERHLGPDCCCRAVPVAAAAACLRPRGVAVLPAPVRLSAAAARLARHRARPVVLAERVRQRPAQVASVEQARRRAEPEASVELARHQARPEVLVEQVLPREAQVASARRVAALPPAGRDAAAVRLPAADAVGAAPGAEVVPLREGPRALVAVVRVWAVPGALALSLAVLSALAFRPDRLRSVPAPQPAVRFARATAGLRTASP